MEPASPTQNIILTESPAIIIGEGAYAYNGVVLTKAGETTTVAVNFFAVKEESVKAETTALDFDELVDPVHPDLVLYFTDIPAFERYCENVGKLLQLMKQKDQEENGKP
jgi:hypothetical protein